MALNDTVKRMDALSAKLEGKTLMDKAAFEKYCEEQVAKAEGEAEKPDLAKKRLEHLHALLAPAAKAFEVEGGVYKFAVYVDPAAQPPPTTATAPATGVQSETNVHFPADLSVAKREKVGKRIAHLAKALDSDEKLRTEVAKDEKLPALLREVIAKGQAQSALATIATMFGYDPNDAEQMGDLRWTISDAISTLQGMARAEGVMAAVGGGGGAAPAKAAKAASGDPGWPLDMTEADFDEKEQVFKDRKHGWDSVA